MDFKERLEQYIKEDTVYNEYLNNFKSCVSDFDRFCIQHCEDIEKLLKENLELEQQCEKQKEVIDRKKYLLIEQGAELKKIYSEINKLQERIDKSIKYLEEPNRDGFDYSKAKLLDILKKVE